MTWYPLEGSIPKDTEYVYIALPLRCCLWGDEIVHLADAKMIFNYDYHLLPLLVLFKFVFTKLRYFEVFFQQNSF